MTTTTETLTAAQVLRRAAKHIEFVGQAKGDFFAKDWPEQGVSAACCAAGAIRVAARLHPEWIMNVGEWPEVVEEADELLAEHLIRLGWRECRDGGDLNAIETIAGWNDNSLIDAAEVAEILRDVAELAA